MKALIATAAMSLATLGFATSASAFTFSPSHTKFKATGQVSLTQNGTTLACTANFRGATSATGREGRIIAANFSGAGGCTAIKANSLPWKVLPTSLSTIKIEQLSLTSPQGLCGPDPVQADLSGGVISFNTTLLPGNCQFSGSLATTPTITIVP